MNENKFSGLADIYSKHRPGYPDALFDYLYGEVGLSCKSTVADVGSGTGIFALYLLKRKSKVFAVEPNTDMRKTAEQTLAAYNNFVSVNGTAENTSLPDASVEFVTAAQAFHWFDQLRFKEECRRILKPSGKIILVWNNRDFSSELIIESEKINRRNCPDFNGFSGGMAQTPDQFSVLFNGSCECRHFVNDLFYDEQGFIGRCLSSSYAPRKNDTNYEPYINELRLLFNKYNVNGVLRLPTVTSSFVGKI